MPLGNATDNARAFLADHKGQFVYSPIYEGFVVWSPATGKFIAPSKPRDTDQLVKKAISPWRDKRKAELQGKGDDPFAAGQLKTLSRLGNPAPQKELIAMLETETTSTGEVGRSLADSEFDRDPYSLGVPRGTVIPCENTSAPEFVSCVEPPALPRKSSPSAAATCVPT